MSDPISATPVTRRTLGTLVIMSLTAAAAACDAGADPTTGRDSVNLGFLAEPENLDFTRTSGAAIPQVLLTNVYEGLVKLDDSGRIQPLLAESWTVSADRRTYDFQLHSNVTFSNGDPFTAETVKFSFERVKSDAWNVSVKKQMDILDHVEVVSPTQARVVLVRPSNEWLFDMTGRPGAMFTPGGIADLAGSPVGTGPYTVSRWTRGESIVLTRRAGYWATKPALSTVTFRYFKDLNAEDNALRTGAVDAIIGFGSPDVLPQLTADGFHVIEGKSNAEVVLAMNNAAGPLRDKRIRQAIRYAIDRAAVLQATAGGHGTLIGTMVPPTDPWYEDLTARYPTDPQKARTLLADAAPGGLTLRFRIPNLPYAQTAAQVVKSDLAKVGVDAKIEVLEFPARWLSEVFNKHDYDLSLIAHVEPRDLLKFGDPHYYWGYDNAEVRKLMAAADAGTLEEQTADLREAGRIVADDAACDWLYLMANLNVVRDGLNGVAVNSVGESFDVTTLTWR